MSIAAALLLGLLVQDASTLHGRVRTDAGEAVVGATVFASPKGFKVGLGSSCEYVRVEPSNSVGHFCPVCQPDRGQRTRTDAEGRFRFEALDPEREHIVYVVAAGWAPVWYPPQEHAPKSLEIVMSAYADARLKAEHTHRGRVLDQEGRPIDGASVAVLGHDTEGGRKWMGFAIDEISVTNARGEFLLTSKAPDTSLYLRIRAEGFAPRTARSQPGDAKQAYRMERGGSLSGRVLDGGKPVAQIELGLIQAAWEPDTLVGEFHAITDSDGRFVFRNVPTGDRYTLFGRMRSVGPEQCLPGHRFEWEAGKLELDLGDLSTQPAISISGKVELSDALPIPRGLLLTVQRRDAWDSIAVELNEFGSFTARGLPPEALALSVGLKGYFLSPRNPNLDPFDPHQLVGRLTKAVPDFRILLQLRDPHDPGEPVRPAIRWLESPYEREFQGLSD